MRRMAPSVAVLVAVSAVALALAGQRNALAADAKEESLTIVLRADTIASPTLTAENGKRVLYVTKGVRIKLTVKSEDKTYKLSIAGKAGTQVTVEKNKQSSPVHLQFTKAGEEHEIVIHSGGKKVSSGLYMKAK